MRNPHLLYCRPGQGSRERSIQKLYSMLLLDMVAHAFHSCVVFDLLFTERALPVRQMALLNMPFPFIPCAEEELWCGAIFGDAGVGTQIFDNMLPVKEVVRNIHRGG